MIPALIRGISVLQLLGSTADSQSLEELAKKTNIPKASLLRILDSLVHCDLIERGLDKKYSALARIIKREKDHESFDRQVDKKLLLLAEQSGGTAEWYIPGESGCVLTRQFSPAGCEVKLSAGPGFLRVWQGELDSVAALGYAFAPELAGGWSNELWYYNKTGKRTYLDRSRFNQVLSEVKSLKPACDLNINNNGVFRMARGVFGDRMNLMGIISLAFISSPRLEEQLKKGEELLLKNINSEEQNENTLLGS